MAVINILAYALCTVIRRSSSAFYQSDQTNNTAPLCAIIGLQNQLVCGRWFTLTRRPDRDISSVDISYL